MKKSFKILGIIFAVLLLFELAVQIISSNIIKTKTAEISEKPEIKLDYENFAASDLAGEVYKNEKEYISDIKTTKFPFGALSIYWEREVLPNTSLDLYVRFLEDEIWSDWHPVIQDEESKTWQEEQNPVSRAIMIADQATAFEYKAVLFSDDPEQTPVLKNIKFTYFNSENKSKIFKTSILSGLTVLLDKTPKMITRAQWGADENLRVYTGNIEQGKPIDYLYEGDKDFYDKFSNEIIIEKTVEKNGSDEYLTWPLEYSKDIKKIVIHHTATTKDLDDPKAAIRNIYYYHTKTRGWGDIGYNYIIDPEGKIYEGRAGGEKVVGAHVGKYNHGSIGIAILGNYQDSEIPFKALQSLMNLIAEKSEKYNIDPEGYSIFRDDNIANILAHRDVASTTCPGDNLYNELLYVKKLVKQGSSSNKTAQSSTAQFAFYENTDRTIVYLKPQKTEKIEFKLKNIGTETWNKSTFLVANQNDDNSNKITFKRDENKESNIAPLKENEVKPGEIGNFTAELTSGLASGLINFEVTPIFNGSKKTSNYIYLPVYVEQPELKYEVVGANFPEGKVKSGQKLTAKVRLRNTGNISWQNNGANPIRLGTDEPRDRISALYSGNRPGIMQESEVKPGAIGTFLFDLTAPAKSGTYEEAFRPVVEGVSWLPANDQLKFTVKIFSEVISGEIAEATLDTVFTPGETKTLWVKVKNTGSKDWIARGKGSFRLKISRNKIIKVSPLVLGTKNILGGNEEKIEFKVTAPDKTGDFKLLISAQTEYKKLNKKFFVLPISVVSVKEKSQTNEKGGPIRVLLSYPGAENPIITADGNFKFYENSKKTQDFTMDDNVEISFDEKYNHYVVKTKDKALITKDAPRLVPENGAIMRIKNYDQTVSWNKEINDNRFRGVLEVRFLDGKMIVINELPLEDYLRGLAELPNDASYEKQKALAIIARTYAKYHRDNNTKFPDKPYDASDDPNIFQKYRGYGYELRVPNMVKAVEETRGMVVTYNGKEVLTPYFSQSDGRTRSAKEVWGWEHTPYLQSVPDPYCEGLELRGHGVGLSGCGAEKAAQDGKKYDEILKYYYQGIEIKKSY